MGLREMTVGELRAALAEFPDYYPVAPFIDGTAGVVTGVRAHVVETDQPVVLIGECDLPLDLIESLSSPGTSTGGEHSYPCDEAGCMTCHERAHAQGHPLEDLISPPGKSDGAA